MTNAKLLVGSQSFIYESGQTYIAGVFEVNCGLPVFGELARDTLKNEVLRITQYLGQTNFDNRLRVAFADTSDEIVKRDIDAVISALVLIKDGAKLKVAHTGICRLMIAGQYNYFFPTKSHSLTNAAELERIQKWNVEIKNGYLEKGVHATKLTRCLGGAIFKSIGMISLPEITPIDLSAKYKFLVCGPNSFFERLSVETIHKNLFSDQSVDWPKDVIIRGL